MSGHQAPRTSPLREAPAIIFDKLSLCLGHTTLFDKLSMTIAGGQCTCILGPSGCGKSTLLRLISGSLLLSYQGTIRIEPEAPTTGKIAWMSQNDLLLPWLSLLDNILLGAKLRNAQSPSLRLKARQLLGLAGLAGYEDALPGTLSGGMRQRGALLRTLMEQRPILLMDEPFSALDALARMKLQDLSARLTRQATVLLVTHDPLEALRLGHTIVVLSKRPARVKNIISVAGSPPRNIDEPGLQAKLSILLKQLMQESEL